MIPKRRSKSTKFIRRASSQRRRKLKKLFQKPVQITHQVNQSISRRVAESLPNARMCHEAVRAADEISEIIAAPGIRVTKRLRIRSVSIPCVLPVKESAKSASKELRRQIQDYQTTLAPGREVALNSLHRYRSESRKSNPKIPRC